jgi:hypothetical protein
MMAADDSRADRMARLAHEILALPSDQQAAATDKLSLSIEDLAALSLILGQKEAALRERHEAREELLARAQAGDLEAKAALEAEALRWAESRDRDQEGGE